MGVPIWEQINRRFCETSVPLDPTLLARITQAKRSNVGGLSGNEKFTIYEKDDSLSMVSTRGDDECTSEITYSIKT